MKNCPHVLLVASVFAALLLSPLAAQRGDNPREGPQTPLPAARKIVPAPPLSPAEELLTFQLPPGFRIELVAGDPVVRDPVAAAFDLSGNLWVAEMTRFNAGMVKDVPALAEGVTSVPPSSIVKLESTRRDGHFDRRTVFMGGLNAPRALMVVRDGVIFADPPRLWLARDTDGDGKSDEQRLLAEDFGMNLINESNANGLVWGRDNVIHNICHNYDFRYRDGKFERRPVQIRGEFGLTQDDFGRLFFNRNSDQLRADLYPQYYTVRNPDLTTAPWANVNLALSQEIWPGHPTPVVNRGYRKGELGKANGGLREDGALMEFSAACSPLIYRGANFPASFYNNVFVPEPAANMIKRNLLLEADARLTAADAYGKREFLTSTDPRFRPVALLNAPDGSMLVVDLYRGMLEEYHLDSSYLVQQSVARGLDKPMFGLGRIWRIVYDGGPLEQRQPDLNRRGSRELVEVLAQPNAWWRDAAQQELVERGDRNAVPALEALVRTAPNPVTRVYALWTLDGLGATNSALLQHALGDSSAKVRATAVRLHERSLGGPDATGLIRQLAAVANDPEPEVAIQLALTLGEARTDEAVVAMYQLFLAQGAHPYMPAAIASGLHGREWMFFHRLADALGQIGPRPEVKTMLAVLAAAMVHAGDSARIDEMIARTGDAGKMPPWARLAVLEGFDALAQSSFRRSITPGRIIKSNALASLSASHDEEVNAAANRIARRLAKIEEEAKARALTARPLNEAEKKLAAAGQATFQICAGCHQLTGTGLPNVAPSLVESPFAIGNPEMLVRIVLNGKEGTPGFPGAMPPIGGAFTDEQIAGVLTYIRNSWGLQAGAVSTGTVAKVREQVGTRINAWTTAELGLLERELAKAAK